MKKLLMLLMTLMAVSGFSQMYPYEPSKEYPFGRLNPEAPPQLADFDLLIGSCDCKSVSRVNQTEWADTVMMTWTFKYIMNGMGVQDETLKADGVYSGSIRQYNADSSKWYVHYYTSSAVVPTLPAWEGNRNQNGDIILYRDQTAPNGMEGLFRLTFSNISEQGYNWAGEWVDKSESIVYPTWRIFCKRKD